MKDLKFFISSGLNTLELKYSPEGWDDNSITLDRSSKYFGIFRSYTIKYKFVKDGAKLLRQIFYSDTANEATLRVEKLNRFSLTYSLIFTGSFDFTSFTDLDDYVEISIKDSGLTNLIKANQDNEYEVTFLTGATFHLPREVGGRTVEFIYFSKLLELLYDRLTDGGYNQGIYGLDMSVLQAEELKPIRIVLTNHNALKRYKMFRAKTTFKDLARTLFTLFQITMGIDRTGGKDILKLYKIEDVFPQDILYETASVTDFKLSLAKEYMCNQILIGHPTPDYGDDTTGKTECNTTTTFKIGKTLNVGDEIELTTAYRADWAGMYYSISHINYIPDEEELFIAVIKQYEGQWTLEFGYVQQTGSQDIVYQFNARITPKKLALLNVKYISSIRLGSANSLQYISGAFNNYINKSRTDDEDVFTPEFTGYDMGGNWLFMPVLFEFNTALPDDFIFSLINNPNGVIRFQYKGNWYKGYIVNASIKALGNSSAKMTLLGGPDNDLTKLIH